MNIKKYIKKAFKKKKVKSTAKKIIKPAPVANKKISIKNKLDEIISTLEFTQKKPNLTVIILAITGAEFSARTTGSISNNKNHDVEFLFITNKAKLDKKKLNTLQKKTPNSRIIDITSSTTVSEAINIGFASAKSDYVTFFCENDVFDKEFCKTVTNHISNDHFDILLTNQLKNSELNRFLNNEPSSKDFSDAFFYGSVIAKKAWADLATSTSQPKLDHWKFILGFNANSLKEKKIIKTNKELSYTTGNEPNPTLRCLAGYFSDIQKISSLIHQNKIDKDQTLASIYKFIRLILKSDPPMLNKRLLACMTAIFIADLHSCYGEYDFENLKEKTSDVLNFGQGLKSEEAYKIMTELLPHYTHFDSYDLGVIETRYLEDLREDFLPRLREKYKTVYLTKPQYYGYHWFNCLVMRAQIKDTKLILATNSIHKFISGGKPVFQLWHGLGLMKKVLDLKTKEFPQKYAVCSSKECQGEMSRIFQIPPTSVFPCGTAQTDKLFNTEKAKRVKADIRGKYNIPKNKKIVFFAPTFRAGTPHYYDIGFSVESLSQQLENSPYLIIAKKHHVFKHIMNKTGQDTCNFYTSNNKQFIVDDELSFFDLLMASDIFITDYSSSIFYAVLRNIPVVFYTPDLEKYLSGDNGLLIDFKKEVPGPVIEEKSESKLIEGITESYQYVDTDKYLNFKKKHVGSCDGNASSRIIEKVQEIIKTREHFDSIQN
ncbi:CDP-glycerol glycerophosphotransferase family protein [Desulfobaculum bizertense]|uniref:CDP-glycerol glycerophosphotransferase, TagB/SpsB family n=1 Tax=Desulfobaculum bizertense DSM 18034 TaxID=1121442 RepID=A0A1T4VZG8_9BACT|nr:CDP-glycerol glycerophosphotransferase family protein [Desulfobaculum bizertense]SKA70215.1 CDP-glycerol glycerophosphotransferase, TagB/SpsB family [Desulfobaculum bizertense DSM 18034]